MNLCIVSYMYPGKHNSSDFVFVKMLVDEFARQGHNCVVVSPFNCLHYKQLHKGVEVQQVGDAEVKVFRPNYLSASNIHIGKLNLSSWLHKKAVAKALKQMWKSGFRPDAVYCHFWSACVEAYPFARKHNIPLFLASGESSIDVNNKDGHLNDLKEYVKGVICVSSKNKDESIEHNLTTADKCFVAPNAIDNSLFRKLDKAECRAKLGLPQDKFIIAFVGWFIDRKGPKRVAEAIKQITENDVYSLFIGSGEGEPECQSILFKGKLPHDDIPTYLNAADAFVLPTLHEGCCNAVVEAMACGLPIISSNRPFNWDVLDETNSIMIDPESVEEIRNAIVELRDNPERRDQLSIGALEKAKDLTIGKRASKIAEFMEGRL